MTTVSVQEASQAPAQAMIQFKDFIFDLSPEIALLKAINVFQSPDVQAFQSNFFSCSADPFTGLLNYFYPSNFFE